MNFFTKQITLPVEIERIITSYLTLNNKEAQRYQSEYRQSLLKNVELKKMYDRTTRQLLDSTIVFGCEECGCDVLSVFILKKVGRRRISRLICCVMKEYKSSFLSYLFICCKCLD